MVSVFLAAIPANVRAAQAICEANEANNATYIRFGALLRIRGDTKIVFDREIVEQAVGRGLTEDEWRSITWNYIGAISKLDHSEIVFEDSEDSEVVDEYWDKQVEGLKRKI